MRLPWMSRSDSRAWRSATTVADLGLLTARWLEGDLRSQAGYAPGYGPDDETAELVPTLAAVNRAGYLTDASQPGFNGAGYDGARWRQRAAVQGYIADLDLLDRIRSAADDADLLVVAHRPDTPPGWPSWAAVTLRENEIATAFGEKVRGRDLRASWAGVSDAAHRSLVAAHQLTLVDPEYGRNDVLWPLLDQLINRIPPRIQTGV